MLVLPLNDGHDKKRFDCGDDDLNRWFSQVARQHKEKGRGDVIDEKFGRKISINKKDNGDDEENSPYCPGCGYGSLSEIVGCLQG